MPDFQDILRESMDMAAEGTALEMRALLRRGPLGHLARMNPWTGRHGWSAAYHPMDVGYLLGRLWLLHLYTGRREFREWAQALLERLVPALTESPLKARPSGVDIYYGLCWGAEISGDEALTRAAFRAADQLIAGLWNEEAGLFYSAAKGRKTNIDSLLALLCLPWCARREPRYMGYFVRHAGTILGLGLLRANGSTFQAAHFDERHRLQRLATRQGWRDDSTWARGQSWAMHNFTGVFEATGEPKFRDAAVRACDWWIARAPEDRVPHYDFDDPERASKPRDSCAAAIAALALVRLSRALPDLAATYRPAAEGTIRELHANYLTSGGLLLHGSWGNAAGDMGRPARFPQEDILPYGNYYFVEAVYRSLTEDWRLFRLDPTGGG